MNASPHRGLRMRGLGWWLMWAAATADPHHTTNTPPKFLGSPCLWVANASCRLTSSFLWGASSLPDRFGLGCVSCDLLKGADTWHISLLILPFSRYYHAHSNQNARLCSLTRAAFKGSTCLRYLPTPKPPPRTSHQKEAPLRNTLDPRGDP